MSEKKAATKNAKPGFFQKVGKFFGKIGTAFKNMWRELHKVTWPTKEKLINYSIIVVLFMLFMMVIIGLLDTGASALVNSIMTKFHPAA